MRVLVGCETSGAVREAFRAKGHDAWSCDLLPTDDDSPYHYQCDVLTVLDKGWDLGIFHPTCTYLANSGVSHLHTDPTRWEKMREGAQFFRTLLDAPLPRKAIENPIMHKYAIEIIGRKPDQIVHPWMFGHPEQKATCLWLVNLPPLMATENVYYPMMDLPDNERQRIHYMSPGPERWKKRSVTFSGLAEAMASQWLTPTT